MSEAQPAGQGHRVMVIGPDGSPVGMADVPSAAPDASTDEAGGFNPGDAIGERPQRRK